ncbi:hypothetical protein PMZ80_003099 [Knufia obscura]|uniref:FAD dependent oxidoreductase domain-containing protein n=1 Tax=Knufia obscura TaxID=1635080 RepID=A0ABR0RU92_9EURO|nr:hypothetical protein PMZ80_003099 [Knufia obscura]
MSARTKRAVPDELRRLISQQMHSDPLLPHSQPTTSSWQLPPHELANIRSENVPEEVDYVIIGSGITACGVVKTLLEDPSSAEKSVAVLEARELCSSATGRNGGQLTRIPPNRHLEIAERYGVEQANTVVRLNLKCLQEMHALAESHGPEFEKDCRHVRLEKFFSYYDEDLYEEAKEALKFYEAQIPEEKGVFKVVSKEETSSVYHLRNAVGGFRFPAGVVSPYRLVTNTLKKLLADYPSRLTINTRTPVTAIHYDSGSAHKFPYMISTSRGPIRAKTVIHCTNGHSGHLNPGLRGSLYPARGVMSAQSAPAQFPDSSRKNSWSFFRTASYHEQARVVEKGHYYAHQHPQTGDVWLGGHYDGTGGYITGNDGEVDADAARNIVTMIPQLFDDQVTGGKASDSAKVWSGILGYTADSLPFVGRLPRRLTWRDGSGEWIAAGYNGWGMVNGLLCGSAVAQMVLGKDLTAWFPETYGITDKRLDGQAFAKDEMLRFYFEETGAFDMASQPHRSRPNKL